MSTKKSPNWKHAHFDGMRDRVSRKLLADIEWTRRTLDRVEAHVKAYRPAGRGSSTVTESLLQGVGAWDALIETERLLFSEEE